MSANWEGAAIRGPERGLSPLAGAGGPLGLELVQAVAHLHDRLLIEAAERADGISAARHPSFEPPRVCLSLDAGPDVG